MDGITGEEWVVKSRRGELCGMVGCGERPTSQCPKCGNHYCYEHLKKHPHIVTPQEKAEEDKRYESWR